VSQIRFVTYSAQPEMTSDDALAAAELQKRGIRVSSYPWDGAPNGGGLTILRSLWNYHLQPAEFLRWLDYEEAKGSNILNKPETLRWNIDKFYLRDLQQRGCPVIPTAFVSRNSRASLAGILTENNWTQAVVKPSISATSHRTWIATPTSSQQEFEALIEDHNVLVQRFMPEIQIAGELSLVFFNGIFSHAMRKTAKTGDFRVQEEYGGRTVGTDVPTEMIAQADRALRVTPGGPHLYARVDGIVSGSEFLIMEVELIEPCLYLFTNPQAPRNFAAAIEALL
jgi:glutathione synthase/RimK-type ligase-like ATP-grasp enzyme